MSTLPQDPTHPSDTNRPVSSPTPVWDVEDLTTIDTAIRSARDGVPTVLTVEGMSGFGKSTLFHEVIERAVGFGRAVAEAVEGDHAPYAVLRKLGVGPPPGAPFVAAQSLRDLIDDRLSDSPVLVGIDDLQWADAESVQTLDWLLSRAVGDRLLVVVASRPLRPAVHAEWQMHLLEANAHRVQLSGLSLSLAQRMARERFPGVEAGTVRRVWHMTDGNPLYFLSLLTRHTPDELDEMRLLPAPTAFARDLELRLRFLGDDATALMRASCVLGSTWQSVIRVAEVAEVEDPRAVVDRLVDKGFLEWATTDLTATVRPAHALVRAAVYQAIPLDERRRLHQRAAEGENDTVEFLRHRVAAADQFDDGLARDLESAAVRLHGLGHYRVAGDLLIAASRLTHERGAGMRRQLDGRIEHALASDFPPDLDALATDGSMAASDRSHLLKGLTAALQNRWHDTLDELAPITTRNDDRTDTLTRYRAETLSAWAGVGGGAPTADIVAHLDRATSLKISDPAFHGFLEISKGTVSGRLAGVAGYQQYTAQVPPAPADTRPEATYHLAFRGMTRLGRGFHESAVADLTEVERRMRHGVMDIGDGLIHAYLGASLWMGGHWQLAETKFRLADDLRQGRGNPMAMALTSLGYTSRGAFDEADAVLGDVRDQLIARPWHEGIEFYLAGLAMRLHPSEDDDRRRQAWAGLQRSFGTELLEIREPHVAFWLMPRALLAIWAQDQDTAEYAIAALANIDDAPRWREGSVRWMRGLLAESQGRHDTARSELDEALTFGITDFPLLHAHLLADHARVAADPRSAAAAGDLYSTLDQSAYAERASGTSTANSPSSGTLGILSDRERDVAVLVGSGLSYAQIARELFISRSTVSFHLTRIYAKTGVTSRHALGDLLRGGTIAV